MSTPVTAEELVELVHGYYPANLLGDDPRYAASEEAQRLQVAREVAMGTRQRWVDLFHRLKGSLPGSKVEDWTSLHSDACWRCRVYLPGTSPQSKDKKALVVLVSILAPFYALYASHLTWEEQRVTSQRLDYPPLPDEFRPYESIVEDLIRSSLGYTRLPNDILFTPVPDLQVGNTLPEQVHLIHCLFTDDLW